MLDLLALLAAPALANGAPEALSFVYTCTGGAKLPVAYVNAGDASYAVVLYEGGLVPMKAGPTGSGVRYVSIGAPALVWHSKGDQGFLAHDDAGETLIAGGCRIAD